MYESHLQTFAAAQKITSYKTLMGKRFGEFPPVVSMRMGVLIKGPAMIVEPSKENSTL